MNRIEFQKSIASPAFSRSMLIWAAIMAMFAHAGAAELDERIWRELLAIDRGEPVAFDETRKRLEEDPELLEKTAAALASLARKTRYHVGVMPVPDWVDHPPPGVPRWSDLTPEQAEEFRQKEARAFKSLPDFGEARWETYFILEGLQRLADRDSVRLIGPLLSETADVLDPLSDAPTPGVQERAVESLNAMHFFSPDLFGGESPRTLEEWRAWWTKNETRFGPIPQPLADLEAENQKTQTASASPAPLATRSATSSPSPLQPVDATPQNQGQTETRPKPSWPKRLTLLLGAVALLLLRKRTQRRGELQ